MPLFDSTSFKKNEKRQITQGTRLLLIGETNSNFLASEMQKIVFLKVVKCNSSIFSFYDIALHNSYQKAKSFAMHMSKTSKAE